MEQFSTFGRFDNFPDLIHGRLKISHRTSMLKMYQIIVLTLKKLNNFSMKLKLSEVNHLKRRNGSMLYEIGIADGSYFHFLNRETLTKLNAYHQVIKNQQTSVFLDVLVIVSYYYHRHEKRISLNSDHNILRFLITSRELNIYLYNAKGIRRLPLDKFLQQIFDKTHDEMKRHHLKTFRIEASNTH
jgi:hypothetical protein